jgi:hypothetical protein
MSDIQDDAYVSNDSDVVKDSAPVDEPVERDPNSDARIGKLLFYISPASVGQRLTASTAQDETDAIDEDNIIDDRTRGAKPKADYTEKEEDDLPREALESGSSSN